LVFALGVCQADLALPHSALDESRRGEHATQAEWTTLTPAARAEAEGLLARYLNPKVSWSSDRVRVSFLDQRSGLRLERVLQTTAKSPAGTTYHLNRRDTWELGEQGSRAAVLCALGVARGCASCTIGAAMQADFATSARRIYDRGNCASLDAPYQNLEEHPCGASGC
jgi:hypothetical protein